MGGLRRMSRSMTFMAALVVASMVVVIAAGVALDLRAGTTLANLRGLATDANRVTDLGDQLLIDLLDAESNARAYILTQRAVYRAAYSTTKSRVQVGLGRLDEAANRLARLQNDVAAIQELVASRLHLLDNGIRVIDGASGPAVQTMLASDAGREAMDRTRNLIEQMVQHATDERDRRSSEEQEHERLIRIAVFLGGILGVVLLGSAALALLLNRHRLIRAQHALGAQAKLWQATVENLQDGVAVFDAAGRLLQWNHNLAPLTGFAPALLRQGAPFADIVAAAAHWDPPALNDAAATAPGAPATEVQIAGRTLELCRSAMPGGGQMLTIGDISRRVEAEAIARQAQKMDVLGQLTGGIAHDFNNLLQIVSANLDLVATRLATGEALPPAWLQSRMQAATEGVDRGARLTRHLLAFARRQPLAPQPIDPAQLLAGLEDMLRRTLGPQVAVEQIISGSLWSLRADAQQLENALLNLAINARDAMAGNPPDRARLTIEARNASLDDAYCTANADVRPGQYVMMAVSDCGCGMDPEQIARAVEPFYTTKPEGQGTGLGLSMVYGFAKQSGGHFKLYSEPGHGTTARLYIPRTTAAAPRQADPVGLPATGQGELLLLVEDDDAVRSAAAHALRGLGYLVEEAPNADAAMAMLEQGLRPALLFTDVMMPGTLTARQMADRAVTLLPRLAVVFTSGYTENSIVHNGQLDPDVHLISKPWRIEDLASRLRLALDMARRPRPPAGLKILLVEDDALVRMITVDMLENLGHVVTEAADAVQAMAALDGVDLMITDVGLGETDGLTLAASVRAGRPGFPIIVATGRPRPDIGADGLVWLAKPYDNAALQMALGAAQARDGDRRTAVAASRPSSVSLS